MCGFVGFFNETDDADLNNKTVRAMADRIVHRGPDQDDYYVDSDVSLGFRRLSIIDLDGGSQPILNEDGTKVIVFNGEIYNYKELRADLEKKGHIFIFRPQYASGIGRIEKDSKKLQVLYKQGYEDAKAHFDEMIEYLEK